MRLLKDITMLLRESNQPLFYRKAATFSEWLKKWLYVGLKFSTSPASTAIITLFQLVSGALLGADVSIKISQSNTNLQSLNTDNLIMVWDDLFPLTRSIIIFAISSSIIKSLLDAIRSVIETRKTNLLIEENRRLPDSSIIYYYHSNILPKIQTLNDSLMADISQIKATETIDSILSLVNNFTSHWDNANETNYSTNLMIHLSNDNESDKEDINNYLVTHWENNNQFFSSSNAMGAIHQIDGILTVVVSKNSTGSRNILREKIQASAHNERMSEIKIMLPIPPSYQSDFYIPGAPLALKSQQPQYIKDILFDMSEWLNHTHKKNISPAQADAIYSYYLNDKTMRSLLSIPCLVNTKITQNGNANEMIKTTIILNIYCSNKDLLRKNHELFNEFCKPMIALLTKAYSLYWISANV
ncbi:MULTISPECIES: hypothetical protein [Pectobacterium]|uniref:hypothetical protein n=1 Tax=Pectobacterium TaxID=122277 RepID=UPI000650FBA9|nr:MULTISPECIES: hypothetical protein [Pectobacterium]KMK81506.1 hypothetical protein KCO_19212 [Pectobacterium brasiliense ICMP 19477]MCL6354346.1 hypothetical protein [Pectobacterium parmentieri]GKV82450.1 hypothetical protein PEC106664_32240 [Pectobacterium carotovorum subsp. carotovorum]